MVFIRVDLYLVPRESETRIKQMKMDLFDGKSDSVSLCVAQRRNKKPRIAVAAAQDSSAPVIYSPVAGMPNQSDLEKAKAEFNRLTEENKIHENEVDEVVLATGVNL
jgi:hypothetical protein